MPHITRSRLGALLVLIAMSGGCSESSPAGTADVLAAQIAARVNVRSGELRVRSTSPVVDLIVPVVIENGSSVTVHSSGPCGTVLERAGVMDWQPVFAPVCTLEGSPSTIAIPAGGRHAFEYVVFATPKSGSSASWEAPVAGVYRLKLSVQASRDPSPASIQVTNTFPIAP